jgi:hypothetical protein
MIVALSRHLLGMVEETDRVVSVRIGNRTGYLIQTRSMLCKPTCSLFVQEEQKFMQNFG